eukprot:COSAG05_NODE_1093_length_5913_cov_38.151703_2_plen_30_part_00
MQPALGLVDVWGGLEFVTAYAPVGAPSIS